ncbi:MAG TPA: hypothetical protein PL045_11230, partial [Chitinophagaceae bacterium]|nr:hypothetical protein [Chitinophagaceae bacterium]
VENISTLRIFNNNYCDNYFDRIISIDGNDARGIDVGLLIKKGVSAEIEQIRTHVDEGLNSKYLKKSSRLDSKNTANAIFSRDCLEVDIKTGGEKLTLLVNHFKAQDGKATSTKKRINQSKRVHELVSDVIAAGRKPIVMGDLNIDTFQKDYDKSLDELYNSSKLIDPFKTLSDKERWTHYYSAKRKVSRLDYILLDKRLQVTATEIFREGLTSKCKQYKGPRLESMKGNDLEASDHCPATVVLEI